MPLYEYYCSSCGCSTENTRKMKDRKKPAVCPGCNGKAELIISGGNFMLIGGGWTGNAHPIVHAPKSEPVKPMPTNYYNCTPEQVHQNRSD